MHPEVQRTENAIIHFWMAFKIAAHHHNPVFCYCNLLVTLIWDDLGKAGSPVKQEEQKNNKKGSKEPKLA